MSKELTIKDAEDFTGTLWNFFESVPLGNSDYQIRRFVLKHCKSGRNYRQIVLQVKEEAINIKKEKLERKKEMAEAEIKKMKIDEIRENMEARLPFFWSKRKKDRVRRVMLEDIKILEAELESLQVELMNRDILIKDAMRRIEVTIDALKETGIYNREDFEKEENEYWKARLLREAEIEMLAGKTVTKGILDSLERTGIMPAEALFNTNRVVGHKLLEEKAKKQKQE